MEVARVFMNGKSQAVRLPKAYRLEGDRVYVKKVGDAVVLLPYHAPWQPLIESLTLFTDDFMAEREQPPLEKRESAFE